MEHGIPSVWALAKNRKQKGLNIICAAGAHLDPVRAVKSAVFELAGMMLTLDDKLEENRDEVEKMLQDSSLVRKMDDHGMLYGLPQAEERLQFLLDDDRPMRTFAEESGEKVNHPDLTEDLQEILQQFRRLQLEVIVVDQTTPEIARNGLHCVKVLIPGMLPMTFGHHLTRITGLERILRVPMELGYAERPLISNSSIRIRILFHKRYVGGWRMSLEAFLHNLHFDIEKASPPDWEVDWDDAPLTYKLYRDLPVFPLSLEVPLTLEGGSGPSKPDLRRNRSFSLVCLWPDPIFSQVPEIPTESEDLMQSYPAVSAIRGSFVSKRIVRIFEDRGITCWRIPL